MNKLSQLVTWHEVELFFHNWHFEDYVIFGICISGSFLAGFLVG